MILRGWNGQFDRFLTTKASPPRGSRASVDGAPARGPAGVEPAVGHAAAAPVTYVPGSASRRRIPVADNIYADANFADECWDSDDDDVELS